MLLPTAPRLGGAGGDGGLPLVPTKDSVPVLVGKLENSILISPGVGIFSRTGGSLETFLLFTLCVTLEWGLWCHWPLGGPSDDGIEDTKP